MKLILIILMKIKTKEKIIATQIELIHLIFSIKKIIILMIIIIMIVIIIFRII